MDLYDSIVTDFTREINDSSSLVQLQDIKVKYLGKKGLISDLNKSLSSLSPEERPKVGQRINSIRVSFNTMFDDKENDLKIQEKNRRLAEERIDVTIPSLSVPTGHMHPVNIIYDEVIKIFTAMGYELASGPEAELDYYNFEALNMPKNHPARDMQDTFYLSENVVLRTHTSPVQIRSMLSKGAPLRVVAPGKTYRSDHDITHSPMFHQVEGILVDKGIHLGDLKGTLTHFVKQMFGNDVPVRFRTSYFPFTEPSMEVDMGCVICKSEGCRVCKNTGWLELGGSGMVAPEVLNAVNIDPKEYSGFAFGMGLERMAMIKYKIDDIRLFFENHIKFLEQF